MTYKKHIVLIFALVSVTTTSIAQIITEFSAYIDGMWSEWSSFNLIPTNQFHAYITGSYDDFVIHPKGHHPSNFNIRVRFNGIVPEPDAKERRRRIRKKDWYKFEGTIEFRGYIACLCDGTVGSGTDREWNSWCGMIVGTDPNPNPYTVKIPATIKISPYKKKPYCYNIYFKNKSGETIGIAFIF